MKDFKSMPSFSPHGKTDVRKKTSRDLIREAYSGVKSADVCILPKTVGLFGGADGRKLRVAAYCRVSTDELSQLSSYELQVQEYTRMINENPDWEFVSIYADEGFSGTSITRRSQFQQMVADCEAGKVDYIITKSMSRFARNTLDSIRTIRLLRSLSPPVEIYFELEHLRTLDPAAEQALILSSMIAEGESKKKSDSIKWAYRKRFREGIVFPVWSLLGYKLNDDLEWVVDPAEAEIIIIIYDMYLNGYSTPQIAEFLTSNEVPTVKGLPVWSSGTVINILKNEKYCGDALCLKTISVDFHSQRNIGQEERYFIRDHHTPIIGRGDWDKVQKLIREKYYIRNRAHIPKPKMVVKGCLTGFVLLDPEWPDDQTAALFS